jgi:hypothetical protein
VHNTSFTKLSDGWNAEPNVPHVQVTVAGGDVLLDFDLNAFQFPQFREGELRWTPFFGPSGPAVTVGPASFFSLS